MYSLDVNFLKDRAEQNQDKDNRFSKLGGNLAGWTPLYLGIAAAVGMQALTSVGWLFLQNQNTQLESNVQELDAQLSRLTLSWFCSALSLRKLTSRLYIPPNSS